MTKENQLICPLTECSIYDNFGGRVCTPYGKVIVSTMEVGDESYSCLAINSFNKNLENSKKINKLEKEMQELPDKIIENLLEQYGEFINKVSEGMSDIDSFKTKNLEEQTEKAGDFEREYKEANKSIR